MLSINNNTFPFKNTQTELCVLQKLKLYISKEEQEIMKMLSFLLLLMQHLLFLPLFTLDQNPQLKSAKFQRACSKLNSTSRKLQNLPQSAQEGQLSESALERISQLLETTKKPTMISMNHSLFQLMTKRIESYQNCNKIFHFQFYKSYFKILDNSYIIIDQIIKNFGNKRRLQSLLEIKSESFLNQKDSFQLENDFVNQIIQNLEKLQKDQSQKENNLHQIRLEKNHNHLMILISSFLIETLNQYLSIINKKHQLLWQEISEMRDQLEQGKLKKIILIGYLFEALQVNQNQLVMENYKNKINNYNPNSQEIELIQLIKEGKRIIRQKQMKQKLLNKQFEKKIMKKLIVIYLQINSIIFTSEVYTIRKLKGLPEIPLIQEDLEKNLSYTKIRQVRIRNLLLWSIRIKQWEFTLRKIVRKSKIRERIQIMKNGSIQGGQYFFKERVIERVKQFMLMELIINMRII
ncbi:unnamed protein product [Paramecium sonneborni]|uniref:Uncharacterized protein n=1 Tax=Paramecium sonneborni TaxID=65129 RepID=A0A8S1RJI4_9CILI|nr:unnamed protein product [Paramecium sonneborni]